MRHIVVCYLVLLCGHGYAQDEKEEEKQSFSLEETIDGSFSSRSFNGTWLNGNEFYYEAPAGLTANVVTPLTITAPKVILKRENYRDYKSPSFTVSSDGSYILIKHSPVSIYRHSTTAKYTIIRSSDISGTVTNVAKGEQLQYCAWSTTHNAVIYVKNNDIYYKGVTSDDIRITSDGAQNFNGVPDWVYEEEVLSSGSANWVSSDGNSIAYIKFDDTSVRDFTYTKFGDEKEFYLYPKEMTIKYPKVGTNNPKFSVYVYNIALMKSTSMSILNGEDTSDYVIFGTRWKTDVELVVYLTNRIQNEGWLVTCRATDGNCIETRTYKSSTGWLKPNLPVFNADASQDAEIVSNEQGFSHIRWNGGSKFLTSGEGVVTSIYGWRSNSNILYFGGSLESNYTQQHIYSVDSISSTTPKCITCDLETPEGVCTYATAAFSTDFSYASITCRGPGPAYVVIRNLDNPTDIVFDDNEVTRTKLSIKLLPRYEDLEVDLPGGKAFVRLLLPPRFNKNLKYPTIVNVYAGPDSNQISQAFSIGIQHYFVTAREYIYAYIDGRGSGRRGDKIMQALYKKLATVEIEDQIAVTSYLQKNKSYINEEKTCIWGWSYGGFATAWTLVKDEENVFVCGLSVAPVTNFMYYDTIYTERYMDLPENNKQGYENTDLSKQAYKFNRKNFFLIHGVADDNVHYQQSMVLTRALELAGVKFQQMSYPDENHSLGSVSSHLYRTIDGYFEQFFPPVPKAGSSILKSSFSIISIASICLVRIM